MFKGDTRPSIKELTEARTPEDGMHFKSRDEAFNFFCMYARKAGFAVRRSTSRKSGIDHELDKQVFECTKS